MKPIAIPEVIEYAKAMNTPVKKAGIASARSVHSISLNADSIIIPTITRAGAVAAEGMALINVAKNALTAKQIATTTLTRPVRPPTAIPEALSTYVVVFDVPKIAPIDVAVASANKALSILDLNPELSSIAFISSSEKIPVCRPVPIKVPIVSNVSDKLKEKIVIKTRGSLLTSEKRERSPGFPKAARNVVGNCDSASEKLMVSPSFVTSSGIPTKAVTTIPIKIAPFTFKIRRIAVSMSPITASSTAGVFNAAIAGTAEEPAMTVPLSNSS